MQHCEIVQEIGLSFISAPQRCGQSYYLFPSNEWLICQFPISGTLSICAYIFADEQIKRNRFLIFDSDQLKTKHRVFRILAAVLY
jgi:hypothetical protein